MSEAVLRTNLWFHRYTALAWIIGVGALGFLVAALYRSVATTDYSSVIESMPEGLRAAFGLDPNMPLTVDGRLPAETYLTTEFLGWGAIMFAIYAVVHGSGAIAREAENGTLDLVLSQPLRRSQLLLSRAMVFVISSAVLFLAIAPILLVGLAVGGGSVNVLHLLLTLFQAWLIALAIAAYSLAFSCLFLSTAKAGAAAGLLTTAFYAIDIVSRTVARVDWLGNVSLFHFYQPQRVMSSGDLSWAGILVSLAVLVGSAAAAVVIFQRRDIPT